jgi:hypothetical protein
MGFRCDVDYEKAKEDLVLWSLELALLPVPHSANTVMNMMAYFLSSLAVSVPLCYIAFMS